MREINVIIMVPLNAVITKRIGLFFVDLFILGFSSVYVLCLQEYALMHGGILYYFFLLCLLFLNVGGILLKFKIFRDDLVHLS